MWSIFNIWMLAKGLQIVYNEFVEKQIKSIKGDFYDRE